MSEKVRFSLASNDFQDSTISKIVFNVTSLTFTPFEAGTRAHFDANIQIFAIAPVPEPGMLLSGMAMITMTAFSRPRRRKAV
ncbi:MAG: hypothetical protein JWL90_4054 [Chthoniobacteraceae bacterium]|nr:hypothetical protein [Chthoniobacteraceae bacterium]